MKRLILAFALWSAPVWGAQNGLCEQFLARIFDGLFPLKVELPRQDVAQFVTEYKSDEKDAERALVQTLNGWNVSRKGASYLRASSMWNQNLFGSELSARLGFQMVGPHKMWVPLAPYLNQQLDGLKTMVNSVRFYSPSRSGKVSDKEYVERFLFQLELPIAQQGDELHHDLNYHLAVILMPERELQLFVEELKVIYNMFFKSKWATTGSGSKARDVLQAQALRKIAMRIDRITGFFQVGLNSDIPKQLLFTGREPGETLSDYVDDIEFRAWHNSEFKDFVLDYSTVIILNSFLENERDHQERLFKESDIETILDSYAGAPHFSRDGRELLRQAHENLKILQKFCRGRS